MSKFKVGDRVRIKDVGSLSFRDREDVGKIGEIVEDDRWRGTEFPYCIDFGRRTNIFSEEELELAEPAVDMRTI